MNRWRVVSRTGSGFVKVHSEHYTPEEAFKAARRLRRKLDRECQCPGVNCTISVVVQLRPQRMEATKMLIDNLRISITFERCGMSNHWRARARGEATVYGHPMKDAVATGATQQVAGARAVRNLLDSIARLGR